MVRDARRRAPHHEVQQVLPDGQISSCFAGLAVQPLLKKYFCSHLTQISSLSRTVSFRSEGRSRVVTNAGRDAVDAAASGDVRGWQGGSIKARELPNRADKTLIRGRR